MIPKEHHTVYFILELTVANPNFLFRKLEDITLYFETYVLEKLNLTLSAKIMKFLYRRTSS